MSVNNLYPPRTQIKRQKMIYHCKFGEFGVMEGQVTTASHFPQEENPFHVFHYKSKGLIANWIRMYGCTKLLCKGGIERAFGTSSWI